MVPQSSEDSGGRKRRDRPEDGFGTVPKLGDARSSPWKFWTGAWAAEGLHGTNTRSGRDVTFSLETPFVSWPVRNAVHLPGDLVLLQLGDDQICVYDPEKNRIALLAKGRGPIAVMGMEDSAEDSDRGGD